MKEWIEVCVKPEFMDGHICYKLRNSLGGYGGIRVIGYQMILVVVAVVDGVAL